MAFHDLFVATAKYAVNADDGTAFTEGDSITNQMDGSTAAKTLAKGSVAILDDNGLLIMGADSPLINNTRTVTMIVGRGFESGDGIPPFSSEPIPKAAMVTYEPFAAGTPCVQFVGEDSSGDHSLNLPDELVAGTNAGIQVILNQQLTDLIPKNYTYTTMVQTGDTAAKILTRLMNLINKEQKYKISASLVGGNKGLKITSTVNIGVGVYGILEWADVVTANTPGAPNTAKNAQEGMNSIADLRKAYIVATADQGNTDGESGARWNIWKEENPFADDTRQYNVITLKWELQPESIGEAIRRVQGNTLAIAADKNTDAGVGAGKMITVIDPILTAIFNADII